MSFHVIVLARMRLPNHLAVADVAHRSEYSIRQESTGHHLIVLCELERLLLFDTFTFPVWKLFTPVENSSAASKDR
jgi:hypothetical protein